MPCAAHKGRRYILFPAMNASVHTFTTARLSAEPLREDHFDLLCRMHEDATLMATLGGVRTAGQTKDYLNRNLDHWDEHGFGLWMFHEITSGAFVGRAGLRHVDIEGIDEVELAYAVLPERQRRGFATEMSAALVDRAFAALGLVQIVCFTLPTNAPSRRVMEKVGFTYERDIVHANRPHVLYRLESPRSTG